MMQYIFRIIIISRLYQIKMEIEIEGVINDEKLEAMLDSLMVADPEILCGSGNRIVKICSNPKCKMALQCAQPFCKDCGVCIHQICQSFPVKSMTQILNSRVGQYKQFMSKILDIDSELIKVIQVCKKQLISQYHVKPLTPQTQKLIDKIYKSKSLKSISGQEGKRLFEKMQEMCFISQDRVAQLLQNYKEGIDRVIKEIADLKRQLLEDYLLKYNIDSVILQCEDQESQSQLMFLREALNNPRKMELLYRGSQHQFRISAFHEKCGEVENTLTLIRTEYGKTIAAFTPYRWHSVPNGQYVSNPAGGSFILSLDLKQKLIPIDRDRLICNNLNYGPWFGGNDMVIYDQCNTYGGSFLTIKSYNSTDKKYESNQEFYTSFSGAKEGYKFKVIEYEVFRVVK